MYVCVYISAGSDKIFCCLQANIFDRVGAYKIYYQKYYKLGSVPTSGACLLTHFVGP